MAKCMEKCCDSKECDIAYMVQKKCYSVSCSSKEDCKPVSVKASKKTPLISAMVMKAEPKEETGRFFKPPLALMRFSLGAFSFERQNKTKQHKTNLVHLRSTK